MSETGSWTIVRANMDRIACEGSEAFEPDTVSNGRDLIDFLRARFAPPTIGRGCWPTSQIGWPGLLDLEVFADRFGVYPPSAEGQPVKVWYEPHTPGGVFSDAFIAEMVAHAPPRSSKLLTRMREQMSGTVTIAAGVDVTEPTGEIWDAERD